MILTNIAVHSLSAAPARVGLPVLLALTALLGGSEVSQQAKASSPVFVFAAAGDVGANSNAAASLSLLDSTGAAFFLTLGDIDYDETGSDAAWCDYIKQRLPGLGPDFPFQLVGGNHEEDGGPDGNIMNHAACMPDRMGSAGTYAARYYFDYPTGAPLIRAIMIAPNLTIGGVDYDFAAGSADYQWLSGAIDGARAAGIPWVAVGMHKVCITAGVKPCEIGTDLLNLLVGKKVDLILHGHDHNYQRSKQLALTPTNCTAISTNNYRPECVVDDGADSAYGKGTGAVIVITGSFGRCCYLVSSGDSEAGYFARIGSTSHGFTKFTVSSDRIDAEFVASTGSLNDSFSIVGAAGSLDEDGDGFSASRESFVSTDPAVPCGGQSASGTPSQTWPADLSTYGASRDRVNMLDLSSYIAPVRKVDTAPGNPKYSARWDLNADNAITLIDLSTLTSLRPPMFGGQKAFGGPVCGA